MKKSQISAILLFVMVALTVCDKRLKEESLELITNTQTVTYMKTPQFTQFSPYQEKLQ